MKDGPIPKDILYGELSWRCRDTGIRQLHYTDVVKHDMKVLGIDTHRWKDLAAHCTKWRGTLKQHLGAGERKIISAADDKHANRKPAVQLNKPLIF